LLDVLPVVVEDRALGGERMGRPKSDVCVVIAAGAEDEQCRRGKQ
jgi:hypothetical protein